MEITIIFRIALVGILVTILNQILKQSGRTGISCQSGGAYAGTLLGDSIYI